MKKEHFQVKGMSCAACQAHVDKAVRNINGVIDCNVNLLTNSMDVEFNEDITSVKEISLSVKKAGYQALLSKGNDKKEKNNKSLIKLIIAIVLMVLEMYVSMGDMMDLPYPSLFHEHSFVIYHLLIQFAIVTPVIIFYSHFFTNGFKRLFKSPNMDSLIALGATASLIYALFSLVMIIVALNNNNHEMLMKYHHNSYLDSVTMILTLVSLGKYLEELSKGKTTKAIEALVDLSPKTARKDNDEIIPIELVNVGDILIVKEGEAIPVDGVIIEGEATIDESNLTGESLPIYKNINNNVLASTLIKTGYIKIKASVKGKNSSFDTLVHLVEEASSSKAPISKLVDKISLYFVPTIIIIAIITFVIHLFVGHFNFEYAFNYGVSVLVIACPCALGLATPVSIMVSTGKGAKSGLIIKNAEILEKSHNVTTVVLDKTGTITEGKPVVSDIYLENKGLLDVIYSIESMSNHPLAKAIIEYCENNAASKVEITNYKMIPGSGVEGYYSSDYYEIGNKIELNNELKELVSNFAKEGKTSLFIKKNGNYVGHLAIRDEIRSTSKEAIKELQKLGIKVIMLTGDKKETALAIGNEVGVDEVIAEVLPIEKSDKILSLKEKNKTIAMVGDGVNDALALTNADIGIAIGGGSEIAMESSDIVLIRNNLMDVVNAIRLSKRTMNTIKVSLFWAFFYNCIGVVLATGMIPSVTLNPMIASAAMSFSSVFVVLTALSINLFKNK